MHNQLEFDTLIIGSGAAGLSLALKLADQMLQSGAKELTSN